MSYHPPYSYPRTNALPQSIGAPAPYLNAAYRAPAPQLYKFGVQPLWIGEQPAALPFLREWDPRPTSEPPSAVANADATEHRETPTRVGVPKAPPTPKPAPKAPARPKKAKSKKTSTAQPLAA